MDKSMSKRLTLVTVREAFERDLIVCKVELKLGNLFVNNIEEGHCGCHFHIALIDGSVAWLSGDYLLTRSAPTPIRKVYVWDNQMVMVLDADGQQIPEYQGPESKVMKYIRRDTNGPLSVERANWNEHRDKFIRGAL